MCLSSYINLQLMIMVNHVSRRRNDYGYMRNYKHGSGSMERTSLPRCSFTILRLALLSLLCKRFIKESYYIIIN
jgi:hypothetical protein